MNNILTIGIIISILMAISGFIASNNYIVPIVVLVIFILYFVLLARPLYNRYLLKINRFHQCYHFINTFIVSLSIRGSVSSALDSSLEIMPEEFHKDIENIETFTIEDKFEHISKYFRFHIFSLFLDLIRIYEEQGGKILEMSAHLLDEIRLIEDYISASQSISRKKLGEFAILWFLTIGIMVFMRFALSEFFLTISSQIFYPIGIFAILFFCLVSIHLAISRLTNLKIKGWNDYEKNK